MVILQQVEFVIISMTLIFGQSLLILCGYLLKYKAHIMGFPICFRELRAKNDITDNKFETS